jgi:predicted alpha/beta superfamily hydrolase
LKAREKQEAISRQQQTALPVNNQRHAENEPVSLRDQIWRPYYDVFSPRLGHHVSGNILVAENVFSPQLDNERDILIYLPPSYTKSSRRYPVLYMQDGQNLFDPATSFAGEWGVDEALEMLAATEGLEAIVVAIPNSGAGRLDEYSPFHDLIHGGGKGNQYLSFIAHSIKPAIDAEFRTLPDRKHTGIMGSSMGGLISLYAYFHREHIFGYAGVMSPSLWFSHGAIFDYVENAPYTPGKIYLDVGTREQGGSMKALRKLANSRQTYGSVRRMKRILVRKGYRLHQQLLSVEEKWAGHSEADWARRLPLALRFFIEP